MLRVAPALALTAAAALPAVAPLRILGGFAGNGRRFRHEPWTSAWFSAGVVRRRLSRPGVAFRADSLCETAQKLQAGFACVGSCASWRVLRSRSVLVASIAIAESRALAPRARTGGGGCLGRVGPSSTRWSRTVLRDASTSRAISATESPYFLGWRIEYACDMLTIHFASLVEYLSTMIK